MNTNRKQSGAAAKATRRRQPRPPRRNFPPFNVAVGSSYRQTSFFSLRA